MRIFEKVARHCRWTFNFYFKGLSTFQCRLLVSLLKPIETNRPEQDDYRTREQNLNKNDAAPLSTR